jgi:hypothetical protein
MAWEILVTSDSRRRAAHRRAAEGPAEPDAARPSRFWAGLQSLVGRVRNLV